MFFNKSGVIGNIDIVCEELPRYSQNTVRERGVRLTVSVVNIGSRLNAW